MLGYLLSFRKQVVFHKGNCKSPSQHITTLYFSFHLFSLVYSSLGKNNLPKKTLNWSGLFNISGHVDKR